LLSAPTLQEDKSIDVEAYSQQTVVKSFLQWVRQSDLQIGCLRMI